MRKKALFADKGGEYPAGQSQAAFPANCLQDGHPILFRFRQQGNNTRPGQPRGPFIQRLFDGFTIQFNVTHRFHRLAMHGIFLLYVVSEYPGKPWTPQAL